ncbi:MAG: hypothetical protein FWG83_03865 [Oscillospiraceae bacterium]|nr:hypothetical protein [Oscillospiraceae bacterium]
MLKKIAASKSKLIIVSALIFAVVTGIILAVWRPWSARANTDFTVSGDAVAVMTTKITVLDGIWDAKRYSDELYFPLGLAVTNGNVVVADSMCDRIVILDGEKNRRIGRPGQYGLTYFDSGALKDGYRENALFMKPSDVAISSNGDVIIADTGNHVIRRMDEEFVVTIAGNGTAGYTNGKEGKAQFNSPRSAAIDSQGNIYVADTFNHCIRLIDPEGNVSLFAGVPEQAGYSDGRNDRAMFREPSGIAVSVTGDIYVADSGNHTIRKISDGNVSTVAGKPGEIDRVSGYPEGGYRDGDSNEAQFRFPRSISMLNRNTVLVADSMNHVVRLVDLTKGETRTLIGNGTAGLYYESAENAKLTRPEGIGTDGEKLYVSDTVNNRVISFPLNARILEGRPSREDLLESTGIATASKYSYNGDIRIFVKDVRVDMERLHPWNTEEYIYVPIRPLLEALGADITVDEKSGLLTVTILEESTVLARDRDYFIQKGAAVTTLDEITRLFPYVLEWYPEYSLIAVHVPSDLEGLLELQGGNENE